MSEPSDYRALYLESIRELFRSLRRSLGSRARRAIPPSLFLHHASQHTEDVLVEHRALDMAAVQRWRAQISDAAQQPATLWWAVCLELNLSLDPTAGASRSADPTAQPFLVVVAAHPDDLQVWWAPVQRDGQGTISEILDEQPMPLCEPRARLLELVGDRFFSPPPSVTSAF